MANIDQKLLLGEILLRLIVILLLTIGTLIISRYILKRWIWPVIKKQNIPKKFYAL